MRVVSLRGKKLSAPASDALAPVKAVKILILSASHSDETASQCCFSADSKVSCRVSSMTLSKAFSRSFLEINKKSQDQSFSTLGFTYLRNPTTSVSRRGSVGSVAVANPVEMDSNLLVIEGKSMPFEPSRMAALTS